MTPDRLHNASGAVKACWSAAFALLVILMSNAIAAQQSDRIELLKHPYPYRAAVTILSDLHRTTVREFDAVHRLVNTQEVITSDDPDWSLLGLNVWAAAENQNSIRGFGFPFADAFMFYDRSFGWFRDYDIQKRALIPSRGDLENNFREWYAKGFIGPIHTFGAGPITSEKAKAAADYLLKTLPPNRPVRVWVNHSKAVTPSGVADVCCTLLNQTLVDLRFRLFRLVGRGAALQEPDALPGHQTVYGYALLFTALCLLVVSGVSFAAKRSKLAATTLLASGLLIGSLQLSTVDFYQGDNSGSPYYNLDLARRLGVAYFWTVGTDRWQSTVRDLELPEENAATGRPSILRVHQFNDGSKGLMFLRNTVDTDERTLSLLSDENLERLVAHQGRSILYLHWLSNPRNYFGTAEGVGALDRLRRRGGDIWTPSAQDLLDQAYAFTYVEYGTSERDGKVLVDIRGFSDPILGQIDAPLDRLANLSFRCRGCAEMDVLVRGVPLSPERFSKEHTGQDIVLTIRSATGPARAPEPVPSGSSK